MNDRPYCPQSYLAAPANVDPTGRFDCLCCGKNLAATPRTHRVPKHTMPAADALMQAIRDRRPLYVNVNENLHDNDTQYYDVRDWGDKSDRLNEYYR